MIGFRTIHSPRSTSPSASNASQLEGGFYTDSDIIRVVPVEDRTQRTLEDVRDQVAHELAVRSITKAEIVDGVRIGVISSFSKSNEEAFLSKVADVVSHQLALHDHLFAMTATAEIATGNPGVLIICGSSADFVQRAILLASSKFIGRVDSAHVQDRRWTAVIRSLGTSTFDEDALWDVVRKSAQAPIDPLSPPPGSKSIDQMLSEARAKLQRIKPMQAYDELRESQVGAPTFLVDIRPQAQRDAEGTIHGSLIIERNVLEWRFDPRSDARLHIVDRYDLRIIVFCQEGYTSSLAAYSLQQLGMLNATDIIGGYQAWKDAGLPVDDITERPKLRSLVSLAGSVV